MVSVAPIMRLVKSSLGIPEIWTTRLANSTTEVANSDRSLARHANSLLFVCLYWCLFSLEYRCLLARHANSVCKTPGARLENLKRASKRRTRSHHCMLFHVFVTLSLFCCSRSHHWGLAWVMCICLMLSVGLVCLCIVCYSFSCLVYWCCVVCFMCDFVCCGPLGCHRSDANRANRRKQNCLRKTSSPTRCSRLYVQNICVSTRCCH